MASRTRFVLDTSAVLALRSDERGADRVAELLNASLSGRVEALVSFMTRMELPYRVASDEGEQAAVTAIRLLDAAGVSWVSCEESILVEAARIKAGGGVSVADAWIATTAISRDAVLVHKDPEFGRLTYVEQERLPR